MLSVRGMSLYVLLTRTLHGYTGMVLSVFTIMLSVCFGVKQTVVNCQDSWADTKSCLITTTTTVIKDQIELPIQYVIIKPVLYQTTTLKNLFTPDMITPPLLASILYRALEGTSRISANAQHNTKRKYVHYILLHPPLHRICVKSSNPTLHL